MKSAAVILSLQVFSPLIGSSAFVLGMRNRNRNHHSGYSSTRTIHASDFIVKHLATAMETEAMSEEDHAFDFIEAATKAAMDRENCETKANSKKKYPIGDFETSSSAPSKSAVAPMSENGNDEFELEFDFIAAATEAAVERENREAIATAGKAATRASAFAFAVYPADSHLQTPSERNATPVQQRSLLL